MQVEVKAQKLWLSCFDSSWGLAGLIFGDLFGEGWVGVNCSEGYHVSESVIGPDGFVAIGNILVW